MGVSSRKETIRALDKQLESGSIDDDFPLSWFNTLWEEGLIVMFFFFHFHLFGRIISMITVGLADLFVPYTTKAFPAIAYLKEPSALFNQLHTTCIYLYELHIT